MKDIKTIRNFVETWLNEQKIAFGVIIVNIKQKRIDINGCGMTTDEIYTLEDTVNAYTKSDGLEFKVMAIESD